MQGATRPYHIDATGDVGGANGGALYAVVLTGGSDAATLTLRENGSSGATILIVKAAINTTVTVPLSGANYDGQLHCTLGGTGPVATIEF